MNLYFRLLMVLIRSFFKSRISFEEKISLNFRILPNDLDINRHLNNGRYLTILDLCSVSFFLRTGALRKMMTQKYKPVIGGAIITYRKGLSLFERFTISMQVKAWDDRWNYFKFEFKKADGTIAAAGYCKGAFLSFKGFVSNQQIDELMSLHRDQCVLPSTLEHWIAAEKGLLSDTSSGF